MNVIGYVPFGALLVLRAVHVGGDKGALWLTLTMAGTLSLLMESLQVYLPSRVPSREDWLLNCGGALCGGILGLILQRVGVMDQWIRIRGKWFFGSSQGAQLLLVLWPMALLFPPPVPFGTGHIREGLEAVWAGFLEGLPFMHGLPKLVFQAQPLTPSVEWWCILLALLVPCLLGFTAIRTGRLRMLFVPVVLFTGVSVSMLSAALSWGPAHMFSWLDAASQMAIVSALVVALIFATAPPRLNAVVVVLVLAVYLGLLNQAPQSPYFAQTLLEWEQGKFIRFNGLAQWFGWLWPYATLGYVLYILRRPIDQN